MYLGLDIGSAYVKVSNGLKFAACVVEGEREQDSPSTCYQLDWNGTSWLVGDELLGGVRFVEIDKYSKEEYQVMVLTALALSATADYVDVKLVTGVPVDYLNSHAAKYQQALKALKRQVVHLRGYNIDKKVTINLSDAYVVEQAALNLGNPDAYDYPSLFLDFGGGTFDASYWVLDEQAMPHRTKKLSDYNLGFDKVLQQYSDALKENYDYSDDWTYCREYLHQDSLFLDGEDKDTKSIRDRILSRYAKRIFTVINSKNMNYRTVRKIFLLGGCANVMQPYLQDVFKKATLVVDEDPQFSNARLFEEIAHTVFS